MHFFLAVAWKTDVDGEDVCTSDDAGKYNTPGVATQTIQSKVKLSLAIIRHVDQHGPRVCRY